MTQHNGRGQSLETNPAIAASDNANSYSVWTYAPVWWFEPFASFPEALG